MARNAKIDSHGIAELLTSTEMHRAIQAVAEDVVRAVEDLNLKVGDRDGGVYEQDLPVELFMTTTDRAHATVMLAHASGEAVQAKHGALTKAAAHVGLEFKGA